MLQLLLIDPDKRHRRAFLRMVQAGHLGHEVVTAANQAEAIERLSEQSFDLVIAELTLPDGDALTLIKRYGRAVPFVIVTDSGNEAAAVAVLKAGAYDYVVKQLDQSHLENIPSQIEAAVRLRNREEEEAEQRRFINALRDTASALNSALDLDDMLARIQRNMQKVIPFECGCIMRVEDEHIVVIHAYRQSEHLRDAFKNWRGQLAANPFFQRIIQTRQPDTRGEVILRRNAQTSHLLQLRGECLCAPVVIDDEVVGLIVVQRPAGSLFKPIHIERLSVFSDQVATALENDHLHQRAIQTALIEERHRLARDLHDSVTQTLFAASVISDSLLKQWDADPSTVEAGLRDLRSLTSDALAEMRSLLLDLRPDSGGIGNLAAQIEQLTITAQQRGNIQINFVNNGSSQPPPPVKNALFRIAQEALNNIVKHACAKMVRVSLTRNPQSTELVIYDNGIGFDMDNQRGQAQMGLTFMQERANEAGIQLKIESQKHHGTRISAVWSSKT